MSQGGGSMQEKAQYQLSELDKKLSNYPALQNFEQQTSVPKVYVVLGLGALYFFLVFFNIAGEFLVNTAGFALPAYWSLQAIFTMGKADDTQWLTYWVVYSFLTVIESMINAVYWFPFYYTFKFVFIMYMALPQTQGAQVVFRSVIQPVFGRFFEGGASSESLRAQADKATGKSS
ncbi:ER membrane protein DP1/Yop1 [Vermiconidia calcicola]|uniref:ER membrane protein DP1/Yop1 n=1 Tax=Vermiconidia calcicola TaxID=1690605 RepID=A0ACC3NGW7_9PEZI|nr:ER membrane protein DP1/Yop1 [Vermiconidia calcicola]